MTTTEAQISSQVGVQFRRLADCLEQAGPELAAQPSLCEGWTVAHVMAHVTMASRYDAATFEKRLAAVGYSFDELSNQIAAHDGRLPFEQLLADLRSPTMAAWTPPGGGAVGALTHVVIHGLDITSANELPRTADDVAATAVLTALTDGQIAGRFGRTAGGRRLHATDLDFNKGEGPVVEASAADLILALSGRPRPGLDLT